MHKIINNEEVKRFEIPDLPGTAILDYEWASNDMVLVHTFVSESLRGKSIGDELAKYAFEYLKTHHKKAIVKCPFVNHYLKYHPEYNELVKAKVVEE